MYVVISDFAEPQRQIIMKNISHRLKQNIVKSMKKWTWVSPEGHHFDHTEASKQKNVSVSRIGKKLIDSSYNQMEYVLSKSYEIATECIGIHAYERHPNRCVCVCV